MRTERDAALRRSDREARERARTELTRAVALEAGAGTGKTAVLVARIVTWCCGPGWQRAAVAGGDEHRIAARVLERVVAITFTERAAAEMEQRVAHALACLVRGETVLGVAPDALGQEASTRARALIAALDRFAVSTIHGFCRQLLARYPLEAGLHPGFVVDADGSLAASVVDEVIRGHLAIAYGDHADPRCVELAAEGVGPPQIAGALRELVANGVPAEALADDPFDATRVASAAARLHATLEALLVPLNRTLPGVRNANMRGALKDWELLQAMAAEARAASELEELLAIAGEERIQSLSNRLKRWAQRNLNVSEQACLGGDAEEIGEASGALRGQLLHLQRVCPERLGPAREVVAGLLIAVRARLDAQGVVTFPDLLQRAVALVDGRPALLVRIRAGIDQLLVDEFQDTDPLQGALIGRIALEGEGGPGLLVVGDPKQSIYGWRDAELAAYEAFVARIEAAGGCRLRLSVNFRSRPEILHEVERIVAPVMHAEPGLQPAFEPLVPGALAENVEGGGEAAVEHWVSWAIGRGAPSASAKGGPDTKADEARELEARALAADLRRRQATGSLRWGHVGVLLRTTGNQETYLRALREADIPYIVERDRSYFRRREVIDAQAMLRAVLDPHDQVALVTLLRSTRVGVPDGALLPLWRHHLPDQIAELRRSDDEALPRLEASIAAVADGLRDDAMFRELPGWELSLVAVVRAIGELRQMFREQQLDLFVAQLRAWLGGETLEAARFLGEHRLANLERFFTDVTGALIDGDIGVQQLLRRLREGAAQRREGEDAPVGDETLDAVRVMTIHKAKGLTFDHVYLLDLHSAPGAHARTAPKPECAKVADRWELALFGATSLAFDAVLARRARVAEAETVRTLYVAATRPRARLVLAGKWPVGRRGDAAATHVALLQRRSGERPDLEALRREAEAGGAVEAEDAQGVRWCLIGAPRVSERVTIAPTTARAAVGIDLAQATREVAACHRAREEAARRMVDPFSRTATGVGKRAVEPTPDRSHGPDGEIAMAAGTVVHRVLETAIVEGGEVAWESEQLARLVPDEVAPALHAGVTRASAELLERFQGSKIAARFAAVVPHIVGREVPLLLAQPVGFIAGSIDLLYRDPDDGALVIADYKTDRVDAAEHVAAAVARYAGQGRVYQEAMQLAFGATTPPRFELWFLWPDRIETL